MRKQNIYVEDPTLNKNEKAPAPLPRNAHSMSRPPARPFKDIKAPASLPRNAHNMDRAPAPLPKDNNLQR